MRFVALHTRYLETSRLRLPGWPLSVTFVGPLRVESSYMKFDRAFLTACKVLARLFVSLAILALGKRIRR